MKYIDYNKRENLKRNKYDFITIYKIYKLNKKFINEKIKNNITVENKELDIEQKKAVYIDEKNTLVLAGAGSGKTLTICAKINYLINELKIPEKEILCLSFTNDSVNDLKSKIKYDIDIFTFHKLALEIINDYNINTTIASDYLKYITNELFLCSYKNISEKDLIYFNNIIVSFINLFKNKDYDISYFDRLIKKNSNTLLLVIKKVYEIYQEELHSARLIDFNDMINTCNKLIKEKGLKRYYKYIIIDEFQDISINRIKLIKNISSSCNSKLFVVGDDFQSIYKFAGSNINLIKRFKKYFGYTKIVKINKTYRNSIELLNVATNFIMKNKNQISKKLYSDKNIRKPIKIIYYKKNIDIKFMKLLDIINDEVLVLGRNNFDINLLKNERITITDKIIYNNIEYEYKTVHASKGLEKENVIIINMIDSVYGFPNKKNNEILDLLLEKDKYKYEEERRLFYVALTRTKNNVYLLVPVDKPSIFVKEILRNNKKYIEVLDL